VLDLNVGEATNGNGNRVAAYSLGKVSSQHDSLQR
jgi:hypothetical protein